MITFDEVKTDLLSIIDADPHEIGKQVLSDEPDPLTGKRRYACFYYYDTDGKPMIDSTCSANEFGAPCCIVGRWFDIHRDVRDMMDTFVKTNDSADSICNEELLAGVLDDEGALLLAFAQLLQDASLETTFVSIRAYIAEATPTGVYEALHPTEEAF